MLRNKLLAVTLPALLAFFGFSESAVAAPKHPRKPPTLRCFKNQTPVKNKAGKTVCKRKATKTTTKKASAAPRTSPKK